MSTAQTIPHEDRGTYLGSHDTAGIAGFHPQLSPSQVYMNKIGQSRGQTVTEPMHFGLVLEPLILAEYARRQAVTLEPQRFIRHPALEWFGGTPDGTVAGRKVGVDAKNVRYANPAEWGEIGSSEVPMHILFQAHHFMTLLDYEAWDIAVLVAGNEFRIYTIERDMEMSDLILEMDEAFWRDHVATQTPPPVDGSDACRRMLIRRSPKVSSDVRPATAEEFALLERYRAHKAEFDKMEVEKKRLENEIVSTIGSAKGISCDFARATLSEVKGRVSIDSKALRADLPDVAAKYEKCGEDTRSLRFTFKD